MIIVIRGTNGSGKSHTVRKILDLGYVTRDDLPEHSRLVKLPHTPRPVLVIGPYTKGRSMGGCDCIRQPSKIYELILWAENRRFHSLLEGVVLATKPYFRLFQDGFDVRYAFFDPPMSQCLANIRRRQTKKGHESKLSRRAMQSKRERAWNMYVDAGWRNMPARRFTDPRLDAMPWIIQQLRDA